MTGVDKLEKELVKHCEEQGLSFKDEAYKVGYEVKEQPTKPIKVVKTKDLSTVTFADAEKEFMAKNSRERLKEAKKLIRVIVTCNNPNKQSYEGEIFTVLNSKLEEIKRMVPFNVPTHVEKILLNMIKEKKILAFKANDKKASYNKTYYLKQEYNIEYLDPITTEEFNAIKQKQLAEQSIMK